MPKFTIQTPAAIDAGLRLLRSDTSIPARDRVPLTDLERLLQGIANGELEIVQKAVPLEDGGDAE